MLIIVVVIVAAGVLLALALRPAATWSLEQIDDRGVQPRIALDPSGSPTIVYYGQRLDALGTTYAQRAGGVWNQEVLDPYGGRMDVLIDAAGLPHVSYARHANETASLYYAVRTGGSWDAEFVDIMGGGAPSLALDSQGRPAIAYEGACPPGSAICDALKYAHWTGSAWETEIVNLTSPAPMAFPSLALDAQDVPHIAYLGSFMSLRYATRADTGWRVDEVGEVSESVGKYLGFGAAALALDASGRPHIAYTVYLAADAPSGDPSYALKYASYDGSGWRNETVDRSLSELAIYSNSELGLAFDPAGHPEISYGAPGLKVATGTGTGWVIETVDASPDCVTSSLAIDASGGRHIAYAAGKYVAPGNWTFGGCFVSGVTYAHAGATSSAGAIPWALVLGGLVSGVMAAVLVLREHRPRGRRRPASSPPPGA